MEAIEVEAGGIGFFLLGALFAQRAAGAFEFAIAAIILQREVKKPTVFQRV